MKFSDSYKEISKFMKFRRKPVLKYPHGQRRKGLKIRHIHEWADSPELQMKSGSESCHGIMKNKRNLFLDKGAR